MTREERGRFFSSFPKYQQKQIQRSYQLGGWKDVFLRNEIDHLCDLVKEVHGIDLFDIRIKIMKRQRFIVDRKTWDEIVNLFSDYDTCFNLDIVFGGVHSKVYALNPKFYELYKKE